MIPGIPKLSANDVIELAKNGSPLLLQVVGRAFGLGAEERTALKAGSIPWWVWSSAGIAAGVVIGARVQRKWPDKMPAWVRGG